MRNVGKSLMALGLMVITLSVVVIATEWPFRSALFPISIAIPLFFTAMVDLLLNLFGRKDVSSKQISVDFKFSEDLDPKLVNRRLLVISLWILCLFFLILLLDFQISIPIFFLLFFKIKGREGWRISIGLTAIAWLCFYGLFVWLLDISFTGGLMHKGLRVLGVG